MSRELTPEQTVALEQFETDAQAATDAAQANKDAKLALMAADATAKQNAQAAIDTLTQALASAQVFISAMVPTPSAAPR